MNRKNKVLIIKIPTNTIIKTLFLLIRLLNMNRKNKVLIIVLVGILTAGIAFGALNIANASNGAGAAGIGFTPGQRRRAAMSENGQGFRGNGIAMHEEIGKLAAFLGIDEDTLTSERQSGKSLVEIAEEHGKSETELKAFFTEEFTNRMDTLLKEEKITKTQYDTIKSYFEGRIDEMINRTNTGMPKWAGKGNSAGRKGMSECTEGSGAGNQGFHRGQFGKRNNP